MLYSGGRNGHNITTPNQVAAVDALVAEISTEPSEDRCVLLVGYDYRMEELFNNSNPGLKRRFPPEAALRLESYSKEELREILKLKLDIYGLDMTKDTATVAHDVLDRMRMSPKFENAGAVETLVNLAKLRLHSRLKETCSYESAITTTTLQPVDFDPEWDRALRADDSRASLFKDFVGFKKIITQFEGYQNLVAGMRRGDIDPRPFVPWNFVFTGPPGTGKTSTARKVGRLYYDMALTPTADVVTCSVTDVVGQYLGETGPKVLSVLEKGLGKVLFIDEAYRLASGVVGRGGSNFQKEAVDELVDAMTKPRYAGNMVIILAGYTAEMERLLRTNPGLRSRFSTHVAFPPLDPHSCLLHLKNQIRKLNIDLVDFEDPGEENKKKVHRLFEKLGKTRGWANARDIESLARTIINSVYMQQGRMGEEADLSALSINTLELIKFLQDMLRERIAVPDIGSEI
ncbi:hypothetical protein K4K57_013001 [Colletotrichum sp. SAR 10_99]|nr:hypothetical protein K4K57_013001 [Colletotrichum sp. SAR 10_99]